jgi:predicted RNA binding protein YcfA (HicA-like mRNA interferase family)
MARTTFSGHEIIGVLTDLGYVPVSREGSHIRLRSENADTGAVRLVDAPQHDEVRIDTLHSIADQCGAGDFHAWCEWIDEHG